MMLVAVLLIVLGKDQIDLRACVPNALNGFSQKTAENMPDDKMLLSKSRSIFRRRTCLHPRARGNICTAALTGRLPAVVCRNLKFHGSGKALLKTYQPGLAKPFVERLLAKIHNECKVHTAILRNFQQAENDGTSSSPF